VLAKVIWRGELRGVPWSRLWAWASGAALFAGMAGLVAFGRDGKMATYGVMVLACTAGLWWKGFGPRRP
jgi:hypothetical protein